MTAVPEAREPVPAGSARPARRLLTVLGLLFGLSVIIGNTIGSGILRTPGQVAQLLPSPTLFIAVWVLGALYALLGANALAELATMMPESGGYTVFVRRALGEYAGFVIGWSDWLSSSSSLALAALVIGDYTRALFALPSGFDTTIGSAVILGFAVLQWRGVKAGSRAQNVTAIAKSIAFVVLVVACFILGNGFESDGPGGAPIPRGLSLAAAAILAMQAVIFTYDGYNGIIYFSGELRDPARDIPRSIFGGVAAVALIYVLVNLAFLYVLPLSRMAGEPLVAATAAREMFGSKGDAIIRTITIISLLSAANAFQLMASRVLHRLGSVGYLAAGAYVNEGGTPAVALMLSSVVALGLVLTGTFEKVLAVTAFFFVAQYALAFASLLVLRRKEPGTPRPYRAKGHPWTTWGVLVLSVAFLIGAVAADMRNSAYSLLLLGASWPLYLLMRPKLAAPNAGK